MYLNQFDNDMFGNPLSDINAEMSQPYFEGRPRVAADSYAAETFDLSLGLHGYEDYQNFDNPNISPEFAQYSPDLTSLVPNYATSAAYPPPPPPHFQSPGPSFAPQATRAGSHLPQQSAQQLPCHSNRSNAALPSDSFNLPHSGSSMPEVSNKAHSHRSEKQKRTRVVKNRQETAMTRRRTSCVYHKVKKTSVRIQ